MSFPYALNPTLPGSPEMITLLAKTGTSSVKTLADQADKGKDANIGIRLEELQRMEG